MRIFVTFASRVFSALQLALGLLLCSEAFADYAEVNRLLRAGQFAQAVATADQYLVGKPKDPQMRFLKGVILTEQGKPQDAITVFTQLIEDYPELPEPYNNLAVLQASQGQFDKARAALEMAIRTNPSYAIAHENLGDVYAKLASQAYSKALQLDAANTGVQPKLNLIRDLFAPSAKDPRPTAAPVSTAPVAPAQVASARVALDANADEVRAAVQAWARAWSRKDVNAYLGAYGRDFAAPGGRKNWERERKKLLLVKSSISVQVSDLDVKVNGNTAQATFKQAYDANSNSLAVNSQKTLDLVREGSRWVIVRESTG